MPVVVSAVVSNAVRPRSVAVSEEAPRRGMSVVASAAVSVVASAAEEARSGTLRGAISVVASAVLPDVGNFGVLIVGQTAHMVVRDLRSW